MTRPCDKCPHKGACRRTKKACKYFDHLDIKTLSLDFTTNDIVENKKDDEYEVSIDTTFVMFPGGAIGQRLEVFYKKKGEKYGQFHEIGTVIVANGRFKIIQW